MDLDPSLIRENASHETNITVTVTVTLEAAAEADTKVTLDFASPRENGSSATRDGEFTAVWDKRDGTRHLHCNRLKLGDGEGYREAHPKH